MSWPTPPWLTGKNILCSVIFKVQWQPSHYRDWEQFVFSSRTIGSSGIVLLLQGFHVVGAQEKLCSHCSIDQWVLLTLASCTTKKAKIWHLCLGPWEKAILFLCDSSPLALTFLWEKEALVQVSLEIQVEFGISEIVPSLCQWDEGVTLVGW